MQEEIQVKLESKEFQFENVFVEQKRQTVLPSISKLLQRWSSLLAKKNPIPKQKRITKSENILEWLKIL